MMRNRLKNILIFSLVICSSLALNAQVWKRGIITDEFIFDQASFPESHAATIEETPKGLVAAWFGGTKERNPDVEIWVSRKVKGNGHNLYQ